MRQLTKVQIKKILEGQRIVTTYKRMGIHEHTEPVICNGVLVETWLTWWDFTIGEVEVTEDYRGTFFLFHSDDGKECKFFDYEEAERLARTRKDVYIERDGAGLPVARVVTRIILQKRVNVSEL